MPAYRSRTTTHGRNMAGARGLWRATGMKDGDFGKPIIAVVNSFTQFVPGHVHLKDLGQLVAREIETAGGVAKEFNTIAIDDGIAMGHDGMLYSLPSRELIADSVEYMVNAHCADAMVCISNCDKITPGMLMAAMRLNIPAVFVSGGPMEAGKVVLKGKERSIDLIDAMIAAADSSNTDAEVEVMERSSCPTCGSCSGMFTANSMNCLVEALGLGLPGNGTVVATHADRRELFLEAGRKIVEITRRYYETDDTTVLPRSIATFAAFENAMTVDIAMGGSTNTVLHLLAAANEGEVPFSMLDIDRLSRRVPVLCKVAPSVPDVHLEDVHVAGGIMAILGELERVGLIDVTAPTVHSETLAEALERWDIRRTRDDAVRTFYRAAPGGVPTTEAFSQSARWDAVNADRQKGVIRDAEHAFSKDGGLAVLYGNIAEEGCIVKTAGVDASILTFSGPAIGVREPGCGGERHPRRRREAGRHRAGALRRPARRTGDAGNAVSHQLPEVEGPRQSLRPDHRWPFLRRIVRIVHRPLLAGGGGGRRHRTGGKRRHDQDRHPGAVDRAGRPRRGAGGAPGGDGGQGRRRVAAGGTAPAARVVRPARLRRDGHQCRARRRAGCERRAAALRVRRAATKPNCG